MRSCESGDGILVYMTAGSFDKNKSGLIKGLC